MPRLSDCVLAIPASEKKVSPGARHVLLVLTLYAERHGASSAFPAVPTLAKATGLTTRGVRNHLVVLRQEGYLDVLGTGLRGTIRYGFGRRLIDCGTRNYIPSQDVDSEPYSQSEASTRNTVPSQKVDSEYSSPEVIKALSTGIYPPSNAVQARGTDRARARGLAWVWPDRERFSVPTWLHEEFQQATLLSSQELHAAYEHTAGDWKKLRIEVEPAVFWRARVYDDWRDQKRRAQQLRRIR